MEIEAEPCLSAFIDQGSVESHRYFLARRTLLEMLRDRGYAVSEEEILLTLSAFRAKFGENPSVEQLRFSSSLASNPINKILVVFLGTDTVKLCGAKEVREIVVRERVNGLILVLQSKMTKQAKVYINENLKNLKIKVEMFQVTELLVNITKHVLKPHHTILMPDAKEKLLKKYNVQESQLPRMLENDPVARYYGYQKGQVVKITYDGELTGTHETYRCIM